MGFLSVAKHCERLVIAPVQIHGGAGLRREFVEWQQCQPELQAVNDGTLQRTIRIYPHFLLTIA